MINQTSRVNHQKKNFFLQKYSHRDGWTDTSIGLIQSGGIRASIDGETAITKLHISTVLPFGDRLVVEDLLGSELKETLEWSVHRYIPVARFGEFLQMSGLRVVYNLSAPIGERVAYMEALCGSCFVPEYSAVQPDKTYRVIMNEYLFLGGDGFDMLRQKPTANITSVGDTDNIIDYIRRKQVIYSRPESRIVFDPELDNDPSDTCTNCNTNEIVQSSAGGRLVLSSAVLFSTLVLRFS